MNSELTQQKKFPCTSCGLCCQHINKIQDLEKFDRGDGVCIKLKDNICSIYETRPDICRIDDSYKKMFAYMNKEHFYFENLKVCKFLQEKAEIPIEQHVVLPDEK